MVPLIELFNAVGVKFLQGSSSTIYVNNNRVGYVDVYVTQDTLGYDRLVLAAGSKLIRPDLKGMMEHAFDVDEIEQATRLEAHINALKDLPDSPARNTVVVAGGRSEEHTSELQSLMRISYAVFCLKKTTYTSIQDKNY